MSMGTKDYNAIASNINGLVKFALTYRERQLLLAVVEQLAGYFKSQNHKFDTRRFIEATGIDSSVGVDE